MIKSSMSLLGASNALLQIKEGMSNRLLDTTKENGAIVVFLRQPSFKDTITIALKNKAIKQTSNDLVFTVFADIAAKKGIDPSSTLLKNVKIAIDSGDSKSLKAALDELNLSASSNSNLSDAN